MTIDIEEVLERAFEQAFRRALVPIVQAKMEELFTKSISTGSALAERLEATIEQGFQHLLKK